MKESLHLNVHVLLGTTVTVKSVGEKFAHDSKPELKILESDVTVRGLTVNVPYQNHVP